MFTKILIANRSEIASRIIRTCNEMGIVSVAVFSDHDAGAPFVRQADEAVALPEGSSYLDGDAIIAAATITGASAIHPGYGFLAENAEFAAGVADAGVTFIGPSAQTIATMGSKVEAIATMEGAGVPVAPHRELGEGVDPLAAAGDIGYPLVVKASRGGGGKGMRIVRQPAGLLAAVEAASREARSSFGDATVYLERYIDRARHIEVQILGDRHGTIVHVYDRECSVQRRFQKVIEEAPAPYLDETTRSGLRDAAVAAARAVGYVGAGTVEFIVGPDGGFSFMEMNTRLQVEHTVTEEVTGIDLVRIQIEIAAGAHIPSQGSLTPPTGHAIEARVYAEDPVDGYAPSTGVVYRFCIEGDVRVDTGIEDGSVVSHHYDAMVAKVIAHAPTRGEAAMRLARSVAGSEIHGVTTNRDLLVHALTADEFLSGAIDTDWLERLRRDMPPRDRHRLHAHAGAAALATAMTNRDRARVLTSIPPGWRNVRSTSQNVAFRHGDEMIEVAYEIVGRSVSVSVEGDDTAMSRVYGLSANLVDLELDTIRMRFRVNHVGDEVFVDSTWGSDHFVRMTRFPVAGDAVAAGSMVADTPGKVVAVMVAVGDVVEVGDALVVIESMKMEQTFAASVSGRVVSIRHGVGDQVDAGTVLVDIDEGVGGDG